MDIKKIEEARSLVDEIRDLEKVRDLLHRGDYLTISGQIRTFNNVQVMIEDASLWENIDNVVLDRINEIKQIIEEM